MVVFEVHHYEVFFYLNNLGLKDAYRLDKVDFGPLKNRNPRFLVA